MWKTQKRICFFSSPNSKSKPHHVREKQMEDWDLREAFHYAALAIGDHKKNYLWQADWPCKAAYGCIAACKAKYKDLGIISIFYSSSIGGTMLDGCGHTRAKKVSQLFLRRQPKESAPPRKHHIHTALKDAVSTSGSLLKLTRHDLGHPAQSSTNHAERENMSAGTDSHCTLISLSLLTRHSLTLDTTYKDPPLTTHSKILRECGVTDVSLTILSTTSSYLWLRPFTVGWANVCHA